MTLETSPPQPVHAGAGTMRRMNSNAPSRKVTASVIAGALVQVLVWWNATVGGPEIPPEIVTALTVLVSFAVGYLTPPAPTENIIEVLKT